MRVCPETPSKKPKAEADILTARGTDRKLMNTTDSLLASVHAVLQTDRAPQENSDPIPDLDAPTAFISPEAAAGVPTLLNTLSESLVSAREAWRQEELTTAPQFQEFSFFLQREEAVSRVIAALVTPWGLHGQGRIFLDLLLGQIGGPHMTRLKEQRVGVRSVKPEARTKARRKIDVIITFEDGFSLGIENKIFDAMEQPNQIADYVAHLESCGQFLLLYLEGTSGECTSIPEKQLQRLKRDNFLISAPARDILLPWLRACSSADNCKARRVSAFLERFETYIDHPSEKSFMNSNETADSVVRSILQSPESLQSAAAVLEHFELAVHTMPNQFLEKLYASLETFVRDETLRWKLRRSTRTWAKNECPLNEAVDVGPFTGLFTLDEWRYVEFDVGGRAWVTFEIGFETKAKQFTWLYATIGVRHYGPYQMKEAKCQSISKIKKEQEIALQQRLNALVFGFINSDEPGNFDWHWQRYIYEPLMPADGKRYSERLLAALTNSEDTTIKEFSEFMIQLGREIERL